MITRLAGCSIAHASLLGLLCLAAACASHPAPVPQQPQRCFLARTAADAAHPIRPNDWLKLMVQLELGQGGIFALRDCTGRTIDYRPRAVCPDSRLDAERPHPVPIAQEAVIERAVGADQRLIWIVSHRFSDGEGYGPLSLVRRVANGVQVQALGSLRMRSERVRLELWPFKGEAVVVASGETCGQLDGRPHCNREVRLMVQRDQDLVDAPLSDLTGQCLQDASFELARHHREQLASGLSRDFELSAALSHDARYIIIEERLVVRDIDPAAPTLPPREVQRIEANRFVRASQGRLISRQHSLWERALSSSGSVAKESADAQR
jgi:hypothetical protein